MSPYQPLIVNHYPLIINPVSYTHLIAEKSLANSKLIVVCNMDEAIELTNSYAPEHLIIETADYMSVAERGVNAGSVFLGSLTPESRNIGNIMLYTT